jgi:NADH-quinone oxidoreductase subunit N
MNLNDLLTILPFVIVVSWACIVLLIDLFIPRGHKGWTAGLAALGMFIALAVTIARFGQTSQAFSGMVTEDGFSTFVNILALSGGLIGVTLAYDYINRMGIERGEYYSLMLFSISGVMLMSMAGNLIIVFLSLELLSVPLYVLSGIARPRSESEEAALKYFLLGTFSTGFLVYGIALVFGATGSTSLSAIAAATGNGSANLGLLAAGAGLLLIGMGFKVAVVPFHMWIPDVYQGAPSAVTAFMSVIAKVGGFAALLRVFTLAFPAIADKWVPLFWVLAALTMILGNVVAIVQSNIKRLLAYSSIAHSGYIMMALVEIGQKNLTNNAVSAALFYLLGYAFTNFGAWAVVIALERAEGKGLNIEDYAGLSRKYPGLAAAMLVFMFSFIGVPPTLGFLGKFYLFSVVIEGGNIPLAIIAVLTSLISAYYYLRVVVVMYMQDGEPQAHRERWLMTTTLVVAVATVVMSVASAPLFTWASQAVLHLF